MNISKDYGSEKIERAGLVPALFATILADHPNHGETEGKSTEG